MNFPPQSSGRDEVTGANVLVALFSERESHAVYFLQLQDMTRLDAVNFISHGIAKAPGRAAQRPVQGSGNQPESHQEPEREEKPSRRNQDALSNYCVNLNKKAMAGKIDPLIGREPEIERTIQILCRRTKNNPLYVGEPGVGKTAIAEGLAKRIVEVMCQRCWHAPPSLRWIWGRCLPAPVTAAISRNG